MYPLIGSNASEDPSALHKCLLPVGNKPMILHLLSAIQACSVGQVLIVTAPRTVSKLSTVIRNAHLSLEVQVIPYTESCTEEDEDEASPMRSFRAAKNFIRGDFVLLPCDLMVFGPNDSSHDIFLEMFNDLADLHRVHGAALTTLLLKDAKLDPEDDSVDRVLTAYSPLTSTPAHAAADGDVWRLLKLTGVGDLEESVRVRMSLLEKFPRVRFESRLVDLHIYFFSYQAALNVLEEDVVSAHEWSIREDFIPKVIKSSVTSGEECIVRVMQATGERLIVRTNSVATWAECNRQYAIRFAPSTLQRVPASSEVLGKNAIGNDALLGEHCRIGDKTLVKRSVLGSHVHVATGAKLVNNVLMDNVVVEEGVKLDNCVLGPRAVIHAKAVLKDCFVAPGTVVAAEVNAKGETLTSAVGARQLDDLFA